MFVFFIIVIMTVVFGYIVCRRSIVVLVTFTWSFVVVVWIASAIVVVVSIRTVRGVRAVRAMRAVRAVRAVTIRVRV